MGLPHFFHCHVFPTAGAGTHSLGCRAEIIPARSVIIQNFPDPRRLACHWFFLVTAENWIQEFFSMLPTRVTMAS